MKAKYSASENLLHQVNDDGSPTFKANWRIIPCSEECRKWEDGKIVEQDVDFKLVADNDVHDRYDSYFVAYPIQSIPEEDQDKLWNEVGAIFFRAVGFEAYDYIQKSLQDKFLITRKP